MYSILLVQLLLTFSLTVLSSSVIPRQNVDDNSLEDEASGNSLQPFIILTKLSGKTFRTGVSSEKIHNEPFYDAGDQIVSVYVYGMWLFYSEPNFNWKSDSDSQVLDSKVEWVFSDDEPKFYEFTFQIQSYRYVGNPDNINSSSLTLYLGHNFTGPDSLSLDTDYPNLPFSKSKALIITGNDPWFLYTQANFVQKTLCAVPEMGLALISDFYLRKTTHALRHISSMRKGACDPSNSRFVYYGLNGTKNSGSMEFTLSSIYF